ncbi:MAG: hypothetical protein WCK02_04040 [Bacteroidota bacterium]
MRKLAWVFYFFFIVISSCTERNKKAKVVSKVDTAEINQTDFKDLLIKYPVDSSELYTVNHSGVFIGQMTIEICDSIEKVNPEFYEAYSEDMNNLSLELSDVLKKMKIESYWSDKRYVKFENNILDMQKLDMLMAKVIFFIKGRNPIIFDLQDVDKELLKKYFNKKTA